MKKSIICTFIVATILLTACESGASNTINSSLGSNDTATSETTEETTDEITTEEHETPYREGSYIVFGHYEQDGDTSNGPEPIEWEIVKEENGKMLLMSRYILDCQYYNSEHAYVTWETSSLRAWLNKEFYNEAFKESEQNLILSVTNSNPDSPFDGSKGGNKTNDKVFCLSVEEILANYELKEWDAEYQYGTCKALQTKVTKYAASKGVSENLENGQWWLRSPGGGGSPTHGSSNIKTDNTYVCYVTFGYSCAGWGVGTDAHASGVGVRPALYLSAK